MPNYFNLTKNSSRTRD